MKKKLIIAVTVIAVAVAGAYLVIRYHAEQKTRRQVESIALRIPYVTGIDYASTAIDWPAAVLRVEKVTVSLGDPAETVAVDEVIVRDVDPAHDVPDRLDVEIHGIHLSSGQPRLQGFQPYLAEAGYKELVIDLHLAYRYDRDSRLLEIEKLEAAADDAGTLSFSARFNNVDLPRLLKNLTDRIYLITALPGVSLSGAELSYADDTLTRRLLEVWGRRTQQSPGETARSLSVTLENRFGPTDRPLTRQALAGLKAFIAAPGTLRVAAAPPEPVSFLRFLWTRNPSDVVELLHIQVRS